jgi:predicted peptidase
LIISGLFIHLKKAIMFLKKSNLLIAVFALLFAGNKAGAQMARFSAEQFIGDKGDTLQYRFLYPDYDTMRKYPIVIFLHGAGERGNDNVAQLKWGVLNFASDEMMKLHPAFVIAPQCPSKMAWSNFERNGSMAGRLQPTPSKPMELVMQLVRKIITTMPVDTNRIYITGLSMGGYGSFDAIERYPNLFAAAMPVCGGGDTSRAKSIAHIPIWIFHGAEDAAVDPQNAINMAEALRKAGAHPGLTIYPETGHFSWIAAYSDKQAMDWLFRQHK